MKKSLVLCICILHFFCISIFAIDIQKKEYFTPSALVGKTIIIPTYNNGENQLNFVYNESVLQNHKFTYQNYSRVIVLGIPIRISNYAIIDEGKKSEVLCLIAEVNGEKVVLAFPMTIKDSDYTASIIAELFYGDPVKRTTSFSRYSVGDICLHYSLADEIKQYETDFANKEVYLGGNDYWASNKQYTFLGFEYKKFGTHFSGEDSMVPSSFSYTAPASIKEQYLDELYAVFKDDKNLFVKVKEENNKHPRNEISIPLTELRNITYDEVSYKEMFKPSISLAKADSLEKFVSRGELFFPKTNLTVKGLLLSKEQNFYPYETISLSNISGHYICLDRIKQVKTFDKEKRVSFNYYLTGKGNEDGVFEDYIAIPLDIDIRNYALNGAEHRIKVKIEEAKREKENLERLAQLEREEKEYRNKLVAKYGQTNATLIMDGEVRIGFTKEMCKEAWGSPSYINNTISSYGKWEQWVYGIGTYLYFSGNKLVVIQN